MKTIKFDLDKLCDKISQLTDENDHTGAKLLIARTFNLKHFIKIFEAIETIHNEEGSMPIGEYRRNVGMRMLSHIKNDYGEQTADKIYQSL